MTCCASFELERCEPRGVGLAVVSGAAAIMGVDGGKARLGIINRGMGMRPQVPVI